MDNKFVPVEKFGKDHWSMLAYIETCCVDGRDGVGVLDLRKVRCNGNTHPLNDVNALTATAWKQSFSTRLHGFFDFADRRDTDKAVEAGLQVLGHDDWDCMNDIEAAGFVEVLSEANGGVVMTELGSTVSGLIRAHKAQGGMYANFVLSKVMPMCDVTPIAVAHPA